MLVPPALIRWLRSSLWAVSYTHLDVYKRQKYNNPESRTDVSPQLPEGREEEIRQDAMKIFQAVGGSGLARIDFFLDKDGVVFNELNTMPGFTAISMYPMLWESRGLAKKELIERLIRTAFHRGE